MTHPAAADAFLRTLTSASALGVRYADLVGPPDALPRLSQALELAGHLTLNPETSRAHLDNDWFGAGAQYGWAPQPVDANGSPILGPARERIVIDAWIPALEASLGLEADGDDPAQWKSKDSQWPRFAPMSAHATVKQKLLAPLDITTITRDRPIDYFWHKTNIPEFRMLGLYGPRRIAIVVLTPGMA
jgi:hypothetical protein